MCKNSKMTITADKSINICSYFRHILPALLITGTIQIQAVAQQDTLREKSTCTVPTNPINSSEEVNTTKIATQLVRKTLQNTSIWCPEHLEAYSYKTDHKIQFTEHPAHLKTDSSNQTKPTAPFFQIASHTKKYFIAPDKHYEIPINYSISGKKDPILVYLNTQVQLLSFCTPHFLILDRRYLNPLSQKGLTSYHFNIQDTLIDTNNNRQYTISFRPLTKTENGLKGILQIKLPAGILTEATACSASPDDNIHITIHQQFQKTEESCWFPTKLNTHIVFKDLGKKNGSNSKLEALSETKHQDIQINPKLLDSLWKNNTPTKLHRNDTTPSSANKYPVNNKQNTSGDFNITPKQLLSTGNIKAGIFDLPISHLIHYNEFEGYRAGLGMQTNNRLHPHWSVGGYAGYGCKDDRWKGGSSLTYFFDKTRGTFFQLSYKKDIDERGGIHFGTFSAAQGNENLRLFLLKHFDYVEQVQPSAHFKIIENFSVGLSAAAAHYHSNDGYFFQPTADKKFSNYSCYALAIYGSYSPRKRKQTTPHTEKKSPTIFISVNKAFPINTSSCNYIKTSLRINFQFNTILTGVTKLSVTGGFLSGKAPAVKLFNGQGSYNQYSLQADNSFATMRTNEFFSTEFAQLFISHNFGPIFYRHILSAPRPVLTHACALGRLQNKTHHQFPYRVSDLSKGYWETGILLQDILKNNLVGFGMGVFYRYGPYRFTDISQNIAYKVVFHLNL